MCDVRLTTESVCGKALPFRIASRICWGYTPQFAKLIWRTRFRRVGSRPNIVTFEHALVLLDRCPDLIRTSDSRAATLHEWQVSCWIYFAGPFAGCGHATGIRCGGLTGCRVNAELRILLRLLFEIETEGGDEVRTGNESIVIDRLADRGLTRSCGFAIAAVLPARGHCLKVHITVQDGIDIDLVSLPRGNLITGAVGDAESVRRAGRGWPRAGVVAERDRSAGAFQKVLRLHHNVCPRWAVRRRRQRVEREGLEFGVSLEVKGRTVVWAGRSGLLARGMKQPCKQHQAKQSNCCDRRRKFVEVFPGKVFHWQLLEISVTAAPSRCKVGRAGKETRHRKVRALIRLQASDFAIFANQCPEFLVRSLGDQDHQARIAATE